MSPSWMMLSTNRDDASAEAPPIEGREVDAPADALAAFPARTPAQAQAKGRRDAGRGGALHPFRHVLPLPAARWGRVAPLSLPPSAAHFEDGDALKG